MILVTMELVIFDTLSYLLQGISVDTIAICLGIKKKKENWNQVLSATPEQDQGAGCCSETAGNTPLVPGCNTQGEPCPYAGAGSTPGPDGLFSLSLRQLWCSAVWEWFGAWFPAGTRQMNSHGVWEYICQSLLFTMASNRGNSYQLRPERL